jgi:hypothetical protein
MGEAGRGKGVAEHTDLILRSGLKGRVSKDGGIWASWFETREDALLTMRVRPPHGCKQHFRSRPGPKTPLNCADCAISFLGLTFGVWQVCSAQPLGS